MPALNVKTNQMQYQQIPTNTNNRDPYMCVVKVLSQVSVKKYTCPG